MKKSHLFFSVMAVALLAYVIQIHLFFSSDVAFLLHATRALLQGGSYTQQFFETNPPMILYIYIPPCWLSQFFSLNILFVFQLYILMLCSVSTLLSGYLLKKIIAPRDSVILLCCYYCILYCLFLLPAYAFGQREHLLLIFLLPYLLSATLALENKPIPSGIALLIGIFAGCGFALKPFFLLPLVLVECYFILVKRRFFGWIRVESLTIFLILLLYLNNVIAFHSDYLEVVLPLVMKYYFIAAKENWVHFIDSSVRLFTFCFGVIFLFFLFYKKNQYNILSTVILLALIGMMAAYILPRSSWFYHFFPAVALACLLGAVCLSQFATKKITAIASIAVIFLIPVQNHFLMISDAIKYKKEATQNQLAAFINTLPKPHHVNCFSVMGTLDCFPYIYKIKEGHFSGRFPFFWWYLGMNLQEKNLNLSKLHIERDYLIERVAEDLLRYPRNIVVIRNYNSFSLIKDFLKNKKFQRAWRNYQYLSTVGEFDVYRSQGVKY